ncbi:MAG: endonuclease/exonuclease/phosphatase family protein [Vulcanimicrobiota bacterium]
MSSPLRVMSFNIRVATARDGPNRWELRREALLRTIQAHFPDLLGCQEVTPHQRQFLEERLSYAYGCRGEGRNSDGSGEQTTVFWRSDRLRLEHWWNFWLSPTPYAPGSRGWDARLPRICTMARLRRQDDQHSLLVANTHLDHWGRQARAHSAELILELMAELAEPDEMLIVLGDLNATEREVPILRLGTRLSDTFRHCSPRAGLRSAGTYHAFLGPYFPLPPRLDYIFVDPRARVRGCLVCRSRAGHRGFPSDHYPVVCELEW